MKVFSIKPKICFDKGSLEYLSTLKGKRTFIITDPFMVRSGLIDRVTEILQKSSIQYEMFSEIKPDPPVETIASGVSKMKDFKPDAVIAMGGGSSIDAAKSILVFTIELLNKNECRYDKPIFIAIPTTSGTGSEVTAFSVISLGNRKFPLVEDDLIPDVAILDADLVKTVPSQITVDTALDVLTHAIEAYVSLNASDCTDALAEKSIKLVFDYLLRAYKNGDDLVAREKLHNASCIAGMAFTNASLGINHSMAHALGGNLHIPHGRANAILLASVIKYNANLELKEKNEAAKKYAEISRILGLPCSSVEEGVNSLIFAIKVLMKETNTPMSLREANINKMDLVSNLQNIIDASLNDKCTATNPRMPNKLELAQLFVEVYEG